MAITEKRKAVIIAALEELIEELKGNGEENGDDEDEDEDPPPAKKTKAKPAAKRGRAKAKAEEEDEDEDESNGEDDEDEDDDAPTMNELRTLAVKASKKATDGKEKVLAALQRHGSERLSEIDEDHYTDLKAMLEKIIEDDDFDPRNMGKKKPAAKKGKAKATADDF